MGDLSNAGEELEAVEGLVDGALFDVLLEHIASLRKLVWSEKVPADPMVRAEGMRYLLRFLAAGIAACVEYDDVDTPELGRHIENRMSWGLDNPDCNYGYTRVRGDRTYLLRGNRGSACHLELQVNTGHMSDGDIGGWQAVSALAGDDLASGPDGEVEIYLSPDEHDATNWMRLDDRASFLMVRQYFDDWERERPAEFTIEQVGYAYPPPPLSPSALAAKVELLCQWLAVGGPCWDAISRGLMGGPAGDITPFLPPEGASGMKGQAYGMGSFRCAPDEAVVLEFTPPECRMWGISLCDRFWQSIDFANRTSSCNSAQAELGDDGTFVGVISQRDPGAANWLDPAGHTEGTLALRYLKPASVPALRYTTVAFDDLAAALPSGTPTCTPDDRSAVIARRRLALQRRYRR